MKPNANKVVLGRLYRKTAKSGTEYFTGRFGYGRIMLFKAREQPENDDEVWNLVVEEIDIRGTGNGRAAKGGDDA
jgi:hypothetical protein